NGTTVVASLSFPVTGWTTWTVRTQNVTLPAGSVRIRATELPNGPNVDNLIVRAVATPTAGGGICAGVPAFQTCVAYPNGSKVVFNNTLYHTIADVPATRDCPP